MLTMLAARPEPVTLPLMSDPRNAAAMLAHHVRETTDVDSLPDFVRGLFIAIGGAIGYADAQDAWVMAGSVLPLDDEALAKMSEAHVRGAFAHTVHDAAYRASSDPDNLGIPVESLPGANVMLRGVGDWRAVDRAARRAVRKGGKRWHVPALGQRIAQRVGTIANSAVMTGKHGRDAQAARAVELDALTDEQREAHEGYCEWSAAYNREVARRVVLEIHAPTWGVPSERLKATGPLFDVDAFAAPWDAEGHGPVQLQPGIVSAVLDEVTRHAHNIFAMGKGRRSPRVSASGKRAATEASEVSRGGPAESAPPMPG